MNIWCAVLINHDALGENKFSAWINISLLEINRRNYKFKSLLLINFKKLKKNLYISIKIKLIGKINKFDTISISFVEMNSISRKNWFTFIICYILSADAYTFIVT